MMVLCWAVCQSWMAGQRCLCCAAGRLVVTACTWAVGPEADLPRLY